MTMPIWKIVQQGARRKIKRRLGAFLEAKPLLLRIVDFALSYFSIPPLPFARSHRFHSRPLREVVPRGRQDLHRKCIDAIDHLEST